MSPYCEKCAKRLYSDEKRCPRCNEPAVKCRDHVVDVILSPRFPDSWIPCQTVTKVVCKNCGLEFKFEEINKKSHLDDVTLKEFRKGS